jgi:hypothetical protein
MDSLLVVLNQNKVLWGVSMLMLNFGARYVISDLGKTHEMLLSNEIMKKVIIMCMFFVATRDILISFLLTVAYVIIIDGMLHEKRKLCILPKSITDKVSMASTSSNVPNADYVKAKAIVAKYESENSKSGDLQELSVSQNYLTNISLIKYSNKAST